MQLSYVGKKNEVEILSTIQNTHLKNSLGAVESNNMLIKGNNLSVIKNLLNQFDLKNKVDLVYIDPPFATNTVFRNGKYRTATISPSLNDEVAYRDTLVGKDFLEFIRERLFLIKELMSDKSSIYVHIDYKIGHYVKVLMDEVFGIANFRNDISRIKCNPKNFQRNGYGNIKDMILFYTKTNNFIWNEPLTDRANGEMDRLFNKVDNQGRKYTTNPLHAPGETSKGRTGQAWKGIMPPVGRHWRYDPDVLDELESKGLIEWSSTGVPRKIIYAEDYAKKRMQDIWEFKDTQKPRYPTEKNLELLKTIISTSSNEKSLVFDCFAGSGTTLIAATQLNRDWIGIDSSDVAIRVSKEKLAKELLSSTINYGYYEEEKNQENAEIKTETNLNLFPSV